MKKVILTFSFLACMLLVSAQPGNTKFDPKAFQARMEQFITTEAGLTPQEAEAFFPVFREMQKKQRVLFEQQQRQRHFKPVGDDACKEAILKSDENELQMKELQLQYHKRFFKILSPSKVFDVIKAEAKFHRQAFRTMAGSRPMPGNRMMPGTRPKK